MAACCIVRTDHDNCKDQPMNNARNKQPCLVSKRWVLNRRT